MQNIIKIVLAACLVYSCASVPSNTHTQADKITVGPGPEDVLLDTLSTNKARLLVSCMNHRLREEAPNGNIYAIDLDQANPKSYRLMRTNEPDGHDFHPHGFDIIRHDGKVYLFVVSHDEKKEEHYVYKYEVLDKTLKFVRSFSHELMNSPNTVVALKDGGFYVSNDQGKRGNQLALLFRAKSGSILYCNGADSWARAADKLAFPNGLYITDKQRYLYASTTRQNKLFKYTMKPDGNLLNREKATQLIGGDNIRLSPNKSLLVTGHLRAFKFIGHAKDSAKTSPSVVYDVNMQNGEKQVVYASDGQQISAASTAVEYKGYLYIAQVFEPFILKVKRQK